MKKVSLSFVGSLFTLGVASILVGCAPSNPNMADRYADANDFGGSNLRFDSNTTSVYENINENSGELKSEDLNTDTVSDAMSAFLNNETSSMAVPQAQSARVSLAAIIQDDPAQTTTGDQAAEAEEEAVTGTPTEAGESTDVEAAVDQTTSARDYFVSYVDPEAVINSRQFTVERDENNRAIGLTVSNGSNTATYMFDNRLETNDDHVLIVSNEDLVAHADGSLTQPTITVLRFAEGQNGNTNLNYRIEGELRVFAAQSLTDVMVDSEVAEGLLRAINVMPDGESKENLVAVVNAMPDKLTEDPVNASAGALESRFLLNFGPIAANVDVIAANCEGQQGPSSQLLCEFNGAEDKDAYVTMGQAVWLSSSVDTVVQDRIEAEVDNENFNIYSHLDYRGEVTAQLAYGDSAPIEISHFSVHQPASEEGVSAVEATRNHFRSSIDMDNIDSYVPLSAVTNDDDDSNDPNNVTLVQKDISNNNLLLTFRFPADTGDGHVDLTLSRIQFVAPASEDEDADETTEPVADETAEPVTDETAEPVAGESTEPVAEETAEPVADETAEPVAGESTEPVTGETTEPVADESAEPVAEETVEPVADESTEPVTGETTEPVADESAEPVVDDGTTEPTNEPQA